MIIGTIKETDENERRVAITPDTCKSFIKLGYDVVIEKDSGKHSNYFDSEYIKAGAKVFDNKISILNSVDILLCVSSLPDSQNLKLMKTNTIFIGMFN